jgi:signal transduction histidine kinase
MKALTSNPRFATVLVALAAFVPAALLVATLAPEEHRIAVGNAEARAEQFVRLAASRKEHAVVRAHQALVVLSQWPSLARARPAACRAHLDELLAQNPPFAAFGFAPARAAEGAPVMASAAFGGEVRCGAGALHGTANLADREWFRRTLETRSFSVSADIGGAITGRPEVVLAYPVLAEPGTPAPTGVVFAAMELSALTAIGAEKPLPEDAVLAVIDRRGRILDRRPDPESWLGQPLVPPQLVRAVVGRREGTTEAKGPDGRPHVYAFTPLLAPDETGLFITVGLPVTPALGERPLWARLALALGWAALLVLLFAFLGLERLVFRPAHKLSLAARMVATGHFGARAGALDGPPELQEEGQAFDEMAAAMQAREAAAEAAARKAAGYGEELRSLAAALESHREEDRSKLGRAVLAVLTHALTGLRKDLAWLSRHLALPEEGAGPESMLQRVASMTQVVDATVHSLRRVGAETRYEDLGDLGLSAAIEKQAHEFQARSGIAVDLSLPASDLPLDRERAAALYRSFQQILSNASHHAGAGKVRVRLAARDGAVELEMRDDGKIITEDANRSVRWQQTLLMRERTLRLGGMFEAIGIPGKGTAVTIRFPLMNLIEAGGGLGDSAAIRPTLPSRPG